MRFVLLFSLAGCGVAQVHLPPRTAGTDRCADAASDDNPVVAALPPAELASLDARMRDGLVAVAYTGCALRVLTECRIPGAYAWQHAPADQTVEVASRSDLQTKLPLGGERLGGDLARAGRLRLETKVSGRLVGLGFDPRAIPTTGACAGATHVVGSVSVGALVLRDANGTAVRESGRVASCEQASDDAPSADCRTPLQASLTALQTAPSDTGGPGEVRVSFRAEVEPERSYWVVEGERRICRVPCDRWLDPSVSYSYRWDPGALSPYRFLETPDLSRYPAGSRVEVRSHPRKTASLVGGILMTTFGGIGTIAGGALLGAGCNQWGGTCLAGIIVLPIGLALIYPGILFIIDSRATMEAQPLASSPLF